MSQKQAAKLCPRCAFRIGEAYNLTRTEETGPCSFCGAPGRLYFIEPKNRTAPAYRVRRTKKRGKS